MSDQHTASILVLNSGSSSLKFGLFEAADGGERLLFEGSADRIGKPDGALHIRSADGAVKLSNDHVMESQTDALQKLAALLAEHGAKPAAVGHRVVHGGPKLRAHQLITADVLRDLRGAVHFAPLHIPPALELIAQAQNIFADVPHFACFDNAFHITLPLVAAHLPLPQRYFDAGVIRYGFHGLSYASIVRRLGQDLPARAVFAHLGSGASLCAVRDGKSLDTSMGLTPTGGVPMGTRSGDLDPGVLLYLMRSESLSADDLETLLNKHSGMAGLADGQSDMQTLCEHADAGATDAALAVEIFATSVRKTIGAYAALMGGIDLLVFTGGIGEHGAAVRQKICDGLGFLGISAEQDCAKVKIMKTDEEMQIALHCRALLRGD